MILKRAQCLPLKIARETNSSVWILTNIGKEYSISLAFIVGTVFQVNQIVNEGETVFIGNPQLVSTKEMIEFSNYHAVLITIKEGMEIW